MADEKPQETAEAPEGNDTPEAPEPQKSDKITLGDGTEITEAQITHWRDRAKNVESGVNKRLQQMNDEFEKRVEEAIAARLGNEARADTNGTTPEGPDFSGLDEFIPGLGQGMAWLRDEVKTIKQAQDETRESSRRFLADTEKEEAWDQVLSQFSDDGYTDPAKVRQVMEKANLEPTQFNADLVHSALYSYEAGYKVGQVDEQSRSKKVAGTPPPMGAGQPSGLPANYAQEAARGPTGRFQKPLHDYSFEDLRDMAMADPRRKST